jgi:uncharacterized protein (TIGR03435 family)
MNGPVCLIAAAALLASHASAQANLSFEVAAVKFTAHGRTADGSSRTSIGIPSPGTLSATNASLEELILWAFELRKYQVSGPIWLGDDAVSFDISAKAAPGATTAQVRQMLQTLLAERFKLAFHRESKTIGVYELVAGKNGPKLQAAKPDAKGGTSTNSGPDGVRLTSAGITMARFAEVLGRRLDRPVLDKTGIQGEFEIVLEYGRENDTAGRPSIFTAIQEQLGLKLEAAKGPMEILVIDHIEKAPTEN